MIYWPNKPGAWPYIKVYLDDMKGIPAQDVWTDIDVLNMMSKERLHYPTQKPVNLLERIIQASSDDGAVVLDPFWDVARRSMRRKNSAVSGSALI